MGDSGTLKTRAVLKVSRKIAVDLLEYKLTLRALVGPAQGEVADVPC